ncbi:hypothetical protein EV421DRAFT_1734935 [Armillaria borealis]|uniref:Uncharacterized protein n=1 Tax=Armillaria borealis TaxID=47425 RepID=A0AA39MT42_9AGAR|nr:hypothetical protein EV421DRAFT_1734935 [Armillaria borealis]
MGKKVDVPLHKLAMYDKGRHSDWRCDSTNGKEYHTTVLVVLNTSWSGSASDLQHNVEPVTSGTRLRPIRLYWPVTSCLYSRLRVRLYDPRYRERKIADGFHGGGFRFGPPHENDSRQFPSSSPCDIQTLIGAIQKIISSGTEEIGIPLRHLYRQSKEYLKGFDAAIYVALSLVHDVPLVPVILRENLDHSSCGECSESEP